MNQPIENHSHRINQTNVLADGITGFLLISATLIFSLCMILSDSYIRPDQDTYTYILYCNISEIQTSLSENSVKEMIQGYTNMVKQEQTEYCELTNIQNTFRLVIAGGNGTDASGDDYAPVTDSLNEASLLFIAKSNRSLQSYYEKLDRLCQSYEVHIAVSSHKENTERKTAVFTQKMYWLIRAVAIMFCVTLITLGEIFWILGKRGELRIKYIWGFSKKKLYWNLFQRILIFCGLSLSIDWLCCWILMRFAKLIAVDLICKIIFTGVGMIPAIFVVIITLIQIRFKKIILIRGL